MKDAKKKRLGAGRVAFLANIEAFRLKINAGYTMQQVYDEHEDQLGISYTQFVNYVNLYIKKKPRNENEREETPKAVEAKTIRTDFKESKKRTDLFDKPKK